MRVPLLLLAILAILLLMLVARLTSDPEAETAQNTSAYSSDESGAETGTVEVRLRPPRPIAPEQFAQPFAQNAVQLERIAARAPLTPPRPQPPRRTVLHRPVVTASGMIVYEQGRLQLAGIQVLAPEETCTDKAGLTWPCGIIARTAFRNFIRGRALSCIAPDGKWQTNIVSQCLIGQQDPAAWLVSQGWARPISGSDYDQLDNNARREEKGIYGSDPRVVQPEPASRRPAIPPLNFQLEPRQ